MSLEQNHYQVLGVSFAATDADIKHNFRKLAKEWHPDTNKAPDAKARFQAITQAYEVLKNKTKRADFDIAYPPFREKALKEAVDLAFEDKETEATAIFEKYRFEDTEIEAAIKTKTEIEKQKELQRQGIKPNGQQSQQPQDDGLGIGTIHDAFEHAASTFSGGQTSALSGNQAKTAHAQSGAHRQAPPPHSGRGSATPQQTGRIDLNELLANLSFNPAHPANIGLFNAALKAGVIDGAWLTSFAAENRRKNGQHHDLCRAGEKLIEDACRQHPSLAAFRPNPAANQNGQTGQRYGYPLRKNGP